MSVTELITKPRDNRYLFYEVNDAGFSEKKKYLIGECYQGKYKITNRGINRTLEIRHSIDFNINNRREFIIPRATIDFTVEFNPQKMGQVTFELVLKGIARREPEIQLIKKILQVQEEDKIIKIESQLKGALPKRMKVGEQKKIIFLFSNKGNQTVKGVKIKLEID